MRCVHTRIKSLENLSSANQILCLVFYLPIERPPSRETSNTQIYSETNKHLTCFAVIGYGQFSPPKIPAIVLEFLLGKDKRVKSFLLLEKQFANCVHTSFTRESVIILSTQVLFAEKCPCMIVGTGNRTRIFARKRQKTSRAF